MHSPVSFEETTVITYVCNHGTDQVIVTGTSTVNNYRSNCTTGLISFMLNEVISFTLRATKKKNANQHGQAKTLVREPPYQT